MDEKTKIMNEGSENVSGSKKEVKKEKNLSGVKMAAAVAGGVVAGNLAWGMAKAAKGAADDYIADVANEDAIVEPEVEAVENTEPEQLPEGGIEAADVSDVVTDDMSFNEAFATARADVGAGGVFEWNGNLYGTHYKEEWDNLSPEETEEYWASVEAADIDIEQEVLPDDILPDVGNEYTADLDGDGYEESILIDSNLDGNIDVVASDLDGDGQIDAVVADTDFDGEADVFVQDTNADGVADVAESLKPEENESEEWVDPGADDPNGIMPMDNNEIIPQGEDVASMGTVDLDGDGYVESEIIDTNADGVADVILSDLDGDGTFDTVIADTDHDGKPDVFVQDTNADGEPDVYETIENEDELADNSNMDNDGLRSDLDSDFDSDADMSEWA